MIFFSFIKYKFTLWSNPDKRDNPPEADLLHRVNKVKSCKVPKVIYEISFINIASVIKIKINVAAMEKIIERLR